MNVGTATEPLRIPEAVDPAQAVAPRRPLYGGSIARKNGEGARWAPSLERTGDAGKRYASGPVPIFGTVSVSVVVVVPVPVSPPWPAAFAGRATMPRASSVGVAGSAPSVVVADRQTRASTMRRSFATR